jgi:hypothetical protein
MDYEILLRGKDGKLQGGHSIKTPGDAPQSITLAQWPDVCNAINKATLATLDDCRAELEAVKAELDAYKKRGLDTAKYVVKVVDDPNISPEQTGILCKQAALGVMENEIERTRQALLAQRAEIDARLNGIAAL